MSNVLKGKGRLYLKGVCLMACLLASNIVLAIDKAIVESDLNERTVVVGESGYFFTNNVIYALDVPVDKSNKKDILFAFPDGSTAKFNAVPFGVGLWAPVRSKSKYDFWSILPAIDGVDGIKYKSVFNLGVSGGSDTYKLVYVRKETVQNAKTGRDINWKNYNLCSSSSSDKDCLKDQSAIMWKIAEGDIFDIMSSK